MTCETPPTPDLAELERVADATENPQTVADMYPFHKAFDQPTVKWLLGRIRELETEAGLYDIGCPCCGDTAAEGLCKDFQPLACGCAGWISVCSKEGAYACMSDDPCPPDALCQPGNDPFSKAVTALEEERDQLRARVEELEGEVKELGTALCNINIGGQS